MSRRFFDTIQGAQELGISVRCFGRVAIEAKVRALKFKFNGKRKLFYTEEHLQQIREYRKRIKR